MNTIFEWRYSFPSRRHCARDIKLDWTCLTVRVVMESSTYVCEPNQVTIHCFVSWLLFPNRLEVADASGSSSFLDFKVSNLFLAAFIAVCGFSVFIMFTAMMCCLFCWWKRKKFNNRKKMKNNFIVKQRSSRTNLNTPVIRSEDIISFVLPAVRNLLYLDHIKCKTFLVSSLLFIDTSGIIIAKKSCARRTSSVKRFDRIQPVKSHTNSRFRWQLPWKP